MAKDTESLGSTAKGVATSALTNSAFSWKFVCRILHSPGPMEGPEAFDHRVKSCMPPYILWCWMLMHFCGCFLENWSLVLHLSRRGYFRRNRGDAALARRKPKVRRLSRGRRTRPSTKNRTQHSRRTTIIETRGRRPKRTVYKEFYEEEW
jgi:hypothetical protein